MKGNGIVDVSTLGLLTNLSRLQLSDNEIVDVSALASLTRLWRLRLANNQIQDISPLVANNGLGRGAQVHLKGNPLSEEAISEQIPALRGRGVTVYY